MIFFYFAEIRYRFFYCVIGFLISFLSSYFYSLELLYLFARPFLHSNHHQVFFEKGFIFTNLTEAFHTTLKICFIWSSVFLLPVFFYQKGCHLVNIFLKGYNIEFLYFLPYYWLF